MMDAEAGMAESASMDWVTKRAAMVVDQIARRGVRDPEVLRALRTVARHRFVPPPYQDRAYEDCALPIGHEATVSQPYMVAIMTERLDVRPGIKVLEIGTGSGYQAAILAEMGARVTSIERVPELADRARATLEAEGYRDVRVLVRDGSKGFPREAPFDRIIVTAAAPIVPEVLVLQLAPEGILVIPVGQEGCQVLYRIVRHADDRLDREEVTPCAFVPLVGEHGFPPPDAGPIPW